MAVAKEQRRVRRRVVEALPRPRRGRDRVRLRCECGAEQIAAAGLYDPTIPCVTCRQREKQKAGARARPRPKVLSEKGDKARVFAEGALYPTPEGEQRPRTRAECPTERPCPWVSCRYHLYLDPTEVGSLRLNFPDLEPWELEETCALDVADEGVQTLEYVGELTNLTRERVRQVEQAAFDKLRGKPEAFDLVGRLRRREEEAA